MPQDKGFTFFCTLSEEVSELAELPKRTEKHKTTFD
jgi:hypothetical protein